MDQYFSVINNVILVGKPNVGKSTLFNRLSNIRLSIAHETPGATRDFLMRDVDIFGHKLTFIDSGGLGEANKKNPFKNLINQAVTNFIINKADLVLFLISAKDGVSAFDDEIAKMLRSSGKPVILVINKIDDEKNIILAADCFRFGFFKEVMISAAQSRGIDNLKNMILDSLNLEAKSPNAHLELISPNNDELSKLALAVVGRPNSGKSTFVNTLLNEDRVLTSEIPGTTLDAVDTYFSYAGKKITLIDTAGIRKQRSIHEEIEKMAVARSLCAIDRAEVVIMMLNAKDGVTEQDQKIAGMVFEKKKACIFAVNKWDEGILDEKNREDFSEMIKFQLPFFSFAPITFISAKYGRNVFDPIDRALRLANRFKKMINTSKLNRSIERAQAAHPAPVEMGRRIKLYFATQVASCPPTFSISCNMPEKLHFSYQRYLTNYLRKDLDLDEIPLRLLFFKK